MIDKNIIKEKEEIIDDIDNTINIENFFEEDDNFNVDVNDDQTIEIDDEDLNDEDTIKKATEIKYNNNAKLMGKHSLDHDYFKGLKNKKDDELNFDPHMEENYDSMSSIENFDIDPSSSAFTTSRNSFEEIRINELKNKVYKVIVEKTDINISAVRRLPSSSKINYYYDILYKELSGHGFSNTELVSELSEYFTDTPYSFFLKLNIDLKKKVIAELRKNHNIKKFDDYDFM